MKKIICFFMGLLVVMFSHSSGAQDKESCGDAELKTQLKARQGSAAAACLPDTALAAASLELDAKTTEELYNHIFLQLGVVSATNVSQALNSVRDGFSSDAAFALTMKDDANNFGPNFIWAQAIRSEQVWKTLQVALVKAGAELEIKETGIEICHLTVSEKARTCFSRLDPAVCFLPEPKVVLVSSCHEVGIRAFAAGRQGKGRLIDVPQFLQQKTAEFPQQKVFRYTTPQFDQEKQQSLKTLLPASVWSTIFCC